MQRLLWHTLVLRFLLSSSFSSQGPPCPWSPPVHSSTWARTWDSAERDKCIFPQPFKQLRGEGLPQQPARHHTELGDTLSEPRGSSKGPGPGWLHCSSRR